MDDKLSPTTVVLMSLIVIWIVTFAKANKISRRRGKILERMEAINGELAALNKESWEGNPTPERRAEIDTRFNDLNVEFDSLNDQF